MQRDLKLEAVVVAKYAAVAPVLDERSRRVWAAAESLAIGYGGDAIVSAATGLARVTVRKGRRELARGGPPVGRIRRPGAGRPNLRWQADCRDALEALVDPLTRGDPTSPLRWTCKSRAKLAAALTAAGWPISSTTVMLNDLGYSLQAPRKRREGTAHPDRNAQFEHINATADRFQRQQPVISAEEGIGRQLQEWRARMAAEGHAGGGARPRFPGRLVREGHSYGVYDMSQRRAWGNDWWRQLGRRAYPTATELFITADAGGSNGYRARAWKLELQRFADETRLRIHVSHFPPSKWNKIEHRLFCHITENWRVRDVDRIGNTSATTEGSTESVTLIRRAIGATQWPEPEYTAYGETV